MTNLYLHDDCIISPLGFTTSENLEKLRNGTSGLKQCANNIYLDSPICAGIIDADNLSKVFSKIGNPEDFTKLEQMMLLAIQDILNKNPDFDRNQSGLVISTTKGNVHLLEDLLGFEEERILLSKLGEIIKDFFGFKQKPIVVSNACISGGLALSVAKKMINAGQFSEAIVVGGDMLSKFIVSGFNSFQALSDTACKPFSKDRNGINLGEAAAAVLVSDSKKAHSNCINLVGDASANDANHISGPSRTGEGLHKSIQNSLKEARISSEVINAISTHGTATVYNDEMEAIAVSRNNLTEIPLNSIKGYYGHTLGASALIESIVCKHMMLNNEIYPSLNFTQLGVSEKINVITEYLKSVNLEYMLKTASGFGGCNLAMIFKKEVGNGES
ncbi:beta-ketoacyl-[acyl-carrier-protein] synthase family protein [Zunongwangia sp. HRR-M8]|uniref:beta-ketoacyl-[acyl-carrier-protein] synthase family protein n=1 Tax=Zunongwangia sp. HRR-M8 TaxID=3015170 RepID=UPI0022DD779E|nr:beta-ketoacyl synthase N-terminal-like domain-containing protein [Zunongwangia sp. HRR-M8]WBL20852.1 beta-ketoacyl synthase N-terminal-like domain-containing protein [Zunongwangia sp. HRR-M8]